MNMHPANTKGDPFRFQGFTCYVYYSRTDRVWLYTAHNDSAMRYDFNGDAPSAELALMFLAQDIANFSTVKGD